MALTGLGIEADVSGQQILLGNLGLFRERGLAADDGAIRRLADEGKTPVLLAVDGRLAGLLAIADRPRPGRGRRSSV